MCKGKRKREKDERKAYRGIERERYTFAGVEAKTNRC